MSANQIDIDFAKAWDKAQGSFSEGVAKTILNYRDNNKLKIKTALDICCGASNLLNVFSIAGIKCAGTETREGMIEYSKMVYPDMSFFLTKKMYEIPTRNKYDLITCNHDIVNYFENFDEWKLFFKTVRKHLNRHGLFVFDFYTKHKLENWNETIYSPSKWIDCITTIKSGLYSKTAINYTYFINYDNYMVKTRDIAVESYYDTNQILQELKNAKFKNIKVVNKDFENLSDIENAERIHIIATR